MISCPSPQHIPLSSEVAHRNLGLQPNWLRSSWIARSCRLDLEMGTIFQLQSLLSSNPFSQERRNLCLCQAGDILGFGDPREDSLVICVQLFPHPISLFLKGSGLLTHVELAICDSPVNT